LVRGAPENAEHGCLTSTIFADERQLFLPVVARLTDSSVR
jgi:hypothetical protein